MIKLFSCHQVSAYLYKIFSQFVSETFISLIQIDRAPKKPSFGDISPQKCD